jgi:hypothetical protein
MFVYGWRKNYDLETPLKFYVFPIRRTWTHIDELIAKVQKTGYLNLSEKSIIGERIRIHNISRFS